MAKKLTEMTLDEVLAEPVAGNANDDLAVWNRLDTFVEDESLPMNDRLRAMRRIAFICGDDEVMTEEHVKAHAHYLAELRAGRG